MMGEDAAKRAQEEEDWLGACNLADLEARLPANNNHEASCSTDPLGAGGGDDGGAGGDDTGGGDAEEHHQYPRVRLKLAPPVKQPLLATDDAEEDAEEGDSSTDEGEDEDADEDADVQSTGMHRPEYAAACLTNTSATRRLMAATTATAMTATAMTAATATARRNPMMTSPSLSTNKWLILRIPDKAGEGHGDALLGGRW